MRVFVRIRIYGIVWIFRISFAQKIALILENARRWNPENPIIQQILILTKCARRFLLKWRQLATNN